MKKFLIAGSSLAAVAAAGSAGAVDVTLGGSIDMGVEFGVGKNKGDFAVGAAYNTISLSLAAAGTTDGGMKYGGSFTLGTATEISISDYGLNAAGTQKNLIKMTASGATDIEAAVYNVSGGQAIDAKDIVGVKINSSWHSVGSTPESFGLGVNVVDAGALCKVAGIADAAVTVTRVTSGGAIDAGNTAANLPGAYLAAGHVPIAADFAVSGVEVGAAAAAAAAASALGTAYVADALTVSAAAFDEADTAGAATASGDLGNFVQGAVVYAGPFMEVKLQSSSTKMVVGAACVEGISQSETNFFLNNASKIVTASDASIYIEGGFGKLTLQTGDYAGGVSAIGDAGDAADLDVEGLALIMEGVGLLGANPFVAVDLAPATTTSPSDLSNLEILTGGTIDMGGLSAAVDVALNSGNVVDIASWDLGLDYSLGDMAVSFAYDSDNDWGMNASMAIAGFGVDATIYNVGDTAHEKTGLFYSIAASTSLNGFGLSLGVDQDMQPTVSLSKSMGGLSLYAGYDAADEGGKVGATLSF